MGVGYQHETGAMGEAKIGFYFDYTTGLPCLSGSSVKGIIRSAFLDTMLDAFTADPALAHLLLAPQIQPLIDQTVPGIRAVVAAAVTAGIALPTYATSLSYFDAFRSANMPSNLIQAQRDYFGAHTYERIGQEGVFHTQWQGDASVLS